MGKYEELSREELLELKEKLSAEYESAKSLGLKLDMSRGKPSPIQLDMAMGLLDAVGSGDVLKASDGMDCRNYGGLLGIPEARKLMADIMGTDEKNVIVYGNSSLNIMYDTIARLMLEGTLGNTPWCRLDKVKFLCPAPGYDRHFAITEHFGIKMIPIPLSDDGPDMDLVEQLVSTDETVKGMWCVPKFSNPTGTVYSDETVRRIAALKPAAPDFRIMWDNAYTVHYLYEDNQPEIPDILSLCAEYGNPNMVYEFSSTSKISFSGGGLAALASSPVNVAEIKNTLSLQTIGFDKINQLRHVRYFKDINGVKEHMMKQAASLRPKFEAVLKVFADELEGLGIGKWTKPLGGYFISFESMPGCAMAIVDKCKEAGVTLTGAGATYPYGKDPMDSNIRIAPSFPSPEEMDKAARLFALCVKLVSVESLLGELL